MKKYFLSISRKAICKLPKTPNVKRRRIDETADESTSSENGGQELIEAKKPRKLKPRKNAKTTKRRSSKSRQSKQSQKNLQDVGKQGRVTRASCRNETFEIHDRNQVLEKDIRYINVWYIYQSVNSTLEVQVNNREVWFQETKLFVTMSFMLLKDLTIPLLCCLYINDVSIRSLLAFILLPAFLRVFLNLGNWITIFLLCFNLFLKYLFTAYMMTFSVKKQEIQL